MSDRRVNPRIVAAVLGALVLVAVILFAVTRGLGQDDVPDDAVAVVDGDSISQEQFDRSLEQAALRQGLDKAPAPDDPQYEALAQQAMGDVLDVAWIQAEAADRGIEVSDRQVQQSLEQTKQQNFKTEQEYQQFLEQSGFTQEDVDLRVRLNLLSQEIQKQVSDASEPVSDDDARKFYEANKSTFEQPESRDVRLILTKDQAQAEEAKSQLEADDSEANWVKVAKEFSTDAATKNSGGLRQGVTEGVLPDQLNAAVFDAPEGQVDGPVQTPLGYYVYEVDKITPGGAQPFDDVSDQIKQQLDSQVQQEDFSAFLADYRDKWINVTVCADDVVMDRCENFTAPAPEACTDEQLDSTGCAPPVLPNKPVSPGTVLPFVTAAGLPQRPRSICDPPYSGEVPADYQPPEGCPAPGGATGLPGSIPGTVPGAAPQGTAPPPG